MPWREAGEERAPFTAARSALLSMWSSLLCGVSDERADSADGFALCKCGLICGKNGLSEDPSNQAPPKKVTRNAADLSLDSAQPNVWGCITVPCTAVGSWFAEKQKWS